MCVRCEQTAAMALGLLWLLLAVVEGTGSTWRVEDCIMASLTATVTIHPDPSDHRQVVVMAPPATAVARGSCAVEDTRTDVTKQRLVLAWSDLAADQSRLERSLLVEFSRRGAEYGVSRMSAVYEVELEVGRQEVKEFVTMTTFNLEPLEFVVAVGRSYTCGEAGRKAMHTVLRRTSDPAGDAGTRLPNASLALEQVRLDAFRGAGAGAFQPGDACVVRRVDMVTVIIGASLLAMVAMVGLAYFIYRQGRVMSCDEV